MVCKSCNNSKKSSNDFTRAVIEINNPDKLVLLRKVVIPASMGTKDDFPPTIGKYYNTLLQYEVSGDLYLYSSDGIPTQLSSDVSELQRQLEQLGLKVDKEILDRIAADAALNNSINTVSGSLSDEVTARQNADNALQGNITALDNSLATVAKSGSYNDLSNKPTIGNATLTIKKNGSNVGTFTANATANKNIDISVPTKTSDLTNDGSDGASQYVESDDLATVATSGSYNDLSNKPTIGNATLTIKRNDTNAGTFTANATTNKSINIAVPTKTSDLTNDGADGTSTYVESDDLPTVDTTYSSSSNNAIANSTVTNSLDRNVMTNLALDSTPSTTTVNLNNTKTNLAHPSSTTTSSISLPVASSTQAGVMNSSTFDAIASNTSNINAILSGAVAITGLPASPTQAELTTAWENETGLTSLMNRAGIYDVTNSKVWTYYTNDNTWYAASNTSQVTVSTFTNSSEGLIKGSTNDGQVFAENDGTGSVNGWDTLTSAVSNNTSKLATIAQGAEVNVQANWTQTNTSADDYIKNKPANLVQDANYVHTDNNFTTTLKNKLDGIESGAEVNVQADWSQSNTSADDYIKNKPTIPTVNNATLTIQKNGTNVQTFTANSSTNKTANITVPTAVSELTNDANYATTTQLNDGLATKQNTLTAGSNITITNDTISATDTTYTAGNAIDITNNVISADIYPADFFTAGENVSGEGTDITLNNTINAPIENVELYGDTYQQTYSGYNLINLVPMTKEQPSYYQQCSIETVADSTLGRNVLHITGTNNFPSVVYQLTQRLESGKYYVLKFTYRSTINNTATRPDLWFAPNWSGNNWDVLSSITNGRMKPGDGDTTSVTPQSTNWKTTSRKFYVDPSQYSSVDTSYSRICFSLGYNSDSGGFEGKEIWLADAELYEITEDEWNADTYTSKDYEPYTGGIPAPNPDYPQPIQVVTGEQRVWVHGKNLFNPVAMANASYRLESDGAISIGAAYTVEGRRYFNSIALKAGTYTLSFIPTTEAPQGLRYSIRDIDSSTDIVNESRNFVNGERQAYTFTLTQDYQNIGICLVMARRTEAGQRMYLYDIQLEPDSTATAYQPYHDQSYIIDLRGKNILNISDFAMGGLSNGNPTTSNYRIQNANHPIAVQPNTTYTLSAQLVSPVQGFRVGIHEIGKDGGFLRDLGWQQIGTAPFTLTTDSDTYFLKMVGSLSTTSTNVTTGGTENTTSCSTVTEFMRGCTLQFELGNTATAYVPYSPIELCKIDDYQDYIYKSGDDWYVHKDIGYTDLATQTWGGASSELKPTTTITDIKYVSSNQEVGAGLAEKYIVRKASGMSTAVGYIAIDTSAVRVNTGDASITPTGLFYYALATATDTKITDATLIGQLEALWNANTYLDTTHFFVTATGSNLPVILDIEAYRKSLDGVLESIPDAQVQSNWTQADSTAVDYIKNKPSLATVATTGSYNDLTNKPTIPAAQVNSDWNANSGVAQILNKPSLAAVATSGSYNDLTNKPTIPTDFTSAEWNNLWN